MTKSFVFIDRIHTVKRCSNFAFFLDAFLSKILDDFSIINTSRGISNENNWTWTDQHSTNWKLANDSFNWNSTKNTPRTHKLNYPPIKHTPLKITLNFLRNDLNHKNHQFAKSSHKKFNVQHLLHSWLQFQKSSKQKKNQSNSLLM